MVGPCLWKKGSSDREEDGMASVSSERLMSYESGASACPGAGCPLLGLV